MGDGLQREYLCNIRVMWLGIFWEGGVCTFHTWEDSMTTAFGFMHAV
jgi:hypothetical protein